MTVQAAAPTTLCGSPTCGATTIPPLVRVVLVQHSQPGARCYAFSGPIPAASASTHPTTTKTTRWSANLRGRRAQRLLDCSRRPGCAPALAAWLTARCTTLLRRGGNGEHSQAGRLQGAHTRACYLSAHAPGLALAAAPGSAAPLRPVICPPVAFGGLPCRLGRACPCDVAAARPGPTHTTPSLQGPGWDWTDGEHLGTALFMQR